MPTTHIGLTRRRVFFFFAHANYEHKEKVEARNNKITKNNLQI